MKRPVVAITMGDPAGVGPEILIRAVGEKKVRQACYPLIVGDLGVLKRQQRQGRRPLQLEAWKPGDPLSKGDRVVPVYSLSSLSPRQSQPGRPSKACGEAAYRYIRTAAELVQSGTAAAMATAPINKSVLQLAGHPYPGHTELLAELTQAKRWCMMLLSESLKVALVTAHLPLQQVPRELSVKRVRVAVELTHEGLRQYFRVARPRIAVAGLNPHAGEGGIFGLEERKLILPAVQATRKKGIRVYGPYAADSLFHQAASGDYDAVVCMYHDQGLIPLKLLDFFGAAGLTLGLPIIRTSVDHGTAYDIAGKNKADASSMREAILLAARLAWKSHKR